MRRVRSRDRGAALLLVLAAVALLTVLAVEFASRASADSLRATRAARDASFRRSFDAGAEAARGLLSELEPATFTTWAQSWNRELRWSPGAGNDLLVRLADENGKLNVARAITMPDEALAIRDAVGRLFDHLARQDAGKAGHWKHLKDKVLQRLSSRTPLLGLDAFRETGLELSGILGSDGLSRYLTCYGNGKINLNTAPKAVLASLDPEFDDAMVDRVAGYRGKREGEPGSYKPFEEPQDLMLVEGVVNRSVGADGQLRVSRNLYEKVQGLLTTKSDCFSARIDAGVEGKRREAWAFFKSSGIRIAMEEILP